MPINLDTGSMHIMKLPDREDGLGSFVGKITEFNDTTPAETVVFPSENRRILVVNPKQMLVVTGYNLSDNTRVVFRKILRSNGIPAQGSVGCCSSFTIAHSIRLHSVDLPCWVLDKCSPIFVIKTPGNYELDVIGVSADVVVTAMGYELQEVNDFDKCCMQYNIPIVSQPERV